MSVSAKDVKELRNKTGAPMMDCKTALTESNGDVEEAIDWLRKKGAQVAEKKSGRVATQGLVGAHVRKEGEALFAALVEVNCETDFVAKNVVFQAFVSDYACRATMAAKVLEEEVTELVSKVGENIKLGKHVILQGGAVVASYIHNQVANDLGSIGVLVSLDGEPTEELSVVAKDIAMHIAATNPKAIDEDGLDETWLDHEREIFVEQARESGKPDNIIEKMVDGRMKKVVRENTLVNQPFVKDMDKTIGKLLEENSAKVASFARVAVGD